MKIGDVKDKNGLNVEIVGIFFLLFRYSYRCQAPYEKKTPSDF